MTRQGPSANSEACGGCVEPWGRAITALLSELRVRNGAYVTGADRHAVDTQRKKRSRTVAPFRNVTDSPVLAVRAT